MDFGTALEADTKPAALVQPGESPLDDPTKSSKTAAVPVSTTCDERADTSALEFLAVMG